MRYEVRDGGCDGAVCGGLGGVRRGCWVGSSEVVVWVDVGGHEGCNV